jgi:heme-degrading monooxygenase HmoA
MWVVLVARCRSEVWQILPQLGKCQFGAGHLKTLDCSATLLGFCAGFLTDIPRSRLAMYSSTFIFAKGTWDEEFYRLDEQIAVVARATPGYLGEESWENTSTGLVSNIYYWDSLEALQTLMHHPAHLEAKSKQANWLCGYQVVISHVLRTYGDAKLAGMLPTAGAV